MEITLKLKTGNKTAKVSLTKSLVTGQVKTAFNYNGVEWDIHFESSYGFPIASSKYQKGLIKIEISKELKEAYNNLLKEVSEENDIYYNQMNAIHY